MRSKARRKNIPILLNFTGEIIKINLRKEEDRFKSQTGNSLLLPPLGSPHIEVIRKVEDGAMFAVEMHVVHGIPPQMHGTLYIVQEHIAKLLYGKRHDLLIVYNKQIESTENKLKPNETMLVGDDLAYFSVDDSSN
jgi:hypothetical protein